MTRSTDNSKQREKRLIYFASFAVAVLAIGAALTGDPALLIALCITVALSLLAAICHKAGWPQKLDTFLNKIEKSFGFIAFAIFFGLVAVITFFKLS